MEISPDEQIALLDFARASIKANFNNQEPDIPSSEKYPILNSKSGAFVTLKINGNLRGCIGYIISEDPLTVTLQNAAVQAATGDPRFPSLTEKELEFCTIEISLLSEPFPINSYEEIEIGKHGLILNQGGSRGLLLPQVPLEHNMNRDEYLSALCRKAGLYPGYWKESQLDLLAFTAEVFSEKEE